MYLTENNKHFIYNSLNFFLLYRVYLTEKHFIYNSLNFCEFL